MQLPKNVELGDRITAKDAAETCKIPFKLRTLCRAIDAGIVRGERIDVGRRSIHLVKPSEFAEDLANLPKCRHEGCDRPALAPSGACSGAHARALETKGTRLTVETRRRMSTSQTKRHRRADKKLRHLNQDGFLNLRQVAAQRHVAPHTVSRWVAEGFLRAECRIIEQERHLLVQRDELERFTTEEWPRVSQRTHRLPHWKALSHRRWAGRKHGAAGGRPPRYTDEQARLVRNIKMRLPVLGRAQIARLVSESTGVPLTEKQVRGILQKPRS